MIEPDFKARRALWTAALRGGEYEQGTGMLRSRGGKEYCCLGVACEVYRKETGEGEWTRVATSPTLKPLFVDSWSSLPDEVYKWFGLPIGDPRVEHPSDGGGSHSRLSYLNDDLGYTFEQIADIVDEQL